MQHINMMPEMGSHGSHDLTYDLMNYGGGLDMGGFRSFTSNPMPDADSSLFRFAREFGFEDDQIPFFAPQSVSDGSFTSAAEPEVAGSSIAFPIPIQDVDTGDTTEDAKPAVVEAYNSSAISAPQTPTPASNPSEVESPMPRKVITLPIKKSKSKGRSGGDKSSNTIKALRAQAANGDIEAAMKLGWGVERITEIFNKNKAAKGIEVYEGQPIDDLELLERIEEKHKYQAEIQKKRQEKLRVRAYAGDMDAARKLKMGKKRMEEIFGNLNGGDEVKKVESEDTQDDGDGIKTPAEPSNFEVERVQMSRMSPMSGSRDAGPGRCPMPPVSNVYAAAENEGDMASSWSAAAEPDAWYALCQVPSPQAAIALPGSLDHERALCREVDAAVQEVARMHEQLIDRKEQVEKLKRELESVQREKAKKTVAKVEQPATKVSKSTTKTPKPAAKILKSAPKKRKAAKIKIEDEDEPKPNGLLHITKQKKKAKRARLSNFPTDEEVSSETQAHDAGIAAY